MLKVYYIRANGNADLLVSRNALVSVLMRVNNKYGTRTLTYAQIGVIADKIINGTVNKFCGKSFEVAR